MSMSTENSPNPSSFRGRFWYQTYGNPFFTNYSYTHTPSSESKGSISGIVVSGGTPPYTITWANNAAGTTYTGNSLGNLAAGSYTGVCMDNNSLSGSVIVVISGTTDLSVGVTLSNEDCLLSSDTKCAITVDSFTKPESSGVYKYLLYKDGDLDEIFDGIAGEEVHTFTDIDNAIYSVVGVDDNNPTFYVDNTLYCGVTGGTTFYDSSYSAGTNPVGIAFGLAAGNKNWFPVTPYRPGIIYIDGKKYLTGLQDNGSVLNMSDPQMWFYTGATKSRATDNRKNWYRGVHHVSVLEGGVPDTTIVPDTPLYSLSGVTLAIEDKGCFFYNTFNNKIYIVDQVQRDLGCAWFTVDPRRSQGTAGNPTSQYAFTTQDWQASSVDDEYQFTTTGVTMGTSWYSGCTRAGGYLAYKGATRTGVRKESTEGYLNTSMLVTPCGYNNYVFETTIADTPSDRKPLNPMGIVLAQFTDDSGYYGVPGMTYDLTFGLNSLSADTVLSSTEQVFPGGAVVYYNVRDRQEYASVTSFNDNNQLFNDVLLSQKYENTPINGGVTAGTKGNEYYSLLDHGCIRLRAERYGQYGEKFKIRMTDTLGANGTGEIQSGATCGLFSGDPSYQSAYDIQFNLLNPATWTGTSNNAPSYSQGTELLKFLGNQRVGIWGMNMGSSNMWYDFYLSGSQSNLRVDNSSYNNNTLVTEEDLEDLTRANQIIDTATVNSATTNISFSTNVENDYYKQYGGGLPGYHKIPWIVPTINIDIQDIKDNVGFTITGGTKISDS